MASLEPSQIVSAITSVEVPFTRPRYLHWDKLIYLKPPADLTHEVWWLALKLGRHRLYKTVPLLDSNGIPFRFLVTDPIPEALHEIDLGAGGKIGVPQQILNTETRDQYYVSSLIQEAITSSQLEGATTTREVAKEMIRTARQPRDRSEQMILNNFHTMQRIGKVKNDALTKEIVLEIHKSVTEKAIDNPDAAGRFRLPNEPVVVEDMYGEVFHTPPDAGELESRMEAMCEFANGVTPGYFIHPALRAIILHFWLAYDHPFIDGNGRTARALFYWAMLHYGFWVCEFLSISEIIRRAPIKYARAFLYTETDENDLTYFIVYHMDVLRRALEALDAYIRARSEKLALVERQMRNVVLLNHRQRALVSHALRHPKVLYTTEGHRLSHGISFQTARNDLIGLAGHGLLTIIKSGKTSYFTPAHDIENQLANMV
ncbi:MAG: Fic family protein [Capsulimonadaceae bacterium]